MRTELRNPEPEGPPIDWLAEFVDEEKQDLPLLLALDDHNDRKVQAVKPVQAVPEARLIPLPDAAPPAYWEPPLHRPMPSQKRLSMPAFVLVGLTVVASLIGAAVLWNQTAQVVDRPDLLLQAPAPSPIEPPPATQLMRPDVVSAPPTPSAGPKVSPNSPVPAKPQPSVAETAGRSTKTAPPRAAANVVPPLIQGAIDRERLAAAAGEVTGIDSPRTPVAPAPTPTSLVTAPPPATSTAASPVTTLGTPPAAKPAANPAPPPPPERDERAINTAAIQTVLDRYRRAFSALSVDGLATVWRSVDTRALARAFDQLEKQTVEFDACRIEIVGEMADASCRGRTSFVPKIGARTPRVESRQWTFRLVHVRSGWVIDRVESR